MIKNKLTYNGVLISFTVASTSILLNFTLKNLSFLSLSVLLSTLYLGVNPILAGVCFTLSFLVDFSINKLICAIASALIACTIFTYLKKKKIKRKQNAGEIADAHCMLGLRVTTFVHPRFQTDLWRNFQKYVDNSTIM